MKRKDINPVPTVKTLRTALCLIALLPTISLANTINKIDLNEYSSGVKVLNAGCKEKGLSGFSGFCLTHEYGAVTYNDPVQTSVTLALEISSFGRFYSTCEHSDSSPVSSLLTKAKAVLQAQRFLDEIKPQDEALSNYVSRFYFCRSKGENDAAISEKVKWFEYMIQKYGSPR